MGEFKLSTDQKVICQTLPVKELALERSAELRTIRDSVYFSITCVTCR